MYILLDSVSWFKKKETGQKYYINKNDGLYEQALSFLIATWSFFSYTAKLDDPQQMLLIVEPPKELLLPGTDPAIQNIVVESLRIMKYLTEVTTTTIILASETLHPAPEQHYRYKLFFQTKDSDVDLQDEDLQKTIQQPSLYEAWNNGRNEAGMWEDSATGQRTISYFRDKNMEFWDDFDELKL